MKSISSRLIELNTALNDINENLTIYHYEKAEDASTPYGVWAETGEGNSDRKNNHKTEQTIEGYIDYFTFEEFDTLIDAIQGALNGLEGCSWSLERAQYEDNTKLIHYRWDWELI